MEIVRSGVGVNYREPPDKIGRVGISDKVLNNHPPPQKKKKKKKKSMLFLDQYSANQQETV